MNKQFPRGCQHCKSPAWRNPCLYYLDNPEASDPPCVYDDFTRNQTRRQRAMVIKFWLVIATALICGVGLFVGLG